MQIWHLHEVQDRSSSVCPERQVLIDLLVGRRSSACNGYVTDPSSHDECVHRTQKHRKPLSETLHHARRARHRAVARNQPHLALRPAPPRRPPHTKRWFRALAVIASGPGHPPRSTVTTRKTRRLARYVFLHGALLLINSKGCSGRKFLWPVAEGQDGQLRGLADGSRCCSPQGLHGRQRFTARAVVPGGVVYHQSSG